MTWLKRFSASLLLTAAFTAAAAYPDKAITWVVPYPAGGGVDATARLVGKFVSEELGQPIVVENKPGPGGTIGAAYVARAKPDGYTFLVGGSGPLAIAPFVIKGMQYDPQKDLQSLSLLVTIPQILVVKADSRFKDFATLLQQAREQRLSIGYGGNGTGQHLSALLLKNVSGADFKLVPYKGTSNVVNDLLGGTIDAAFVDPSGMGLVKSGDLRAFAVTTPARVNAYPQIPTLQEQGLKGAVLQSFYALSAPAGLPAEIAAKVGDAARKALAQPEVRQTFLQQGMEPAPTSAQEAEKFIGEQRERSGQLLSSLEKQ